MFDYQAAYVSLREDVMATFSSGGTPTRSMREQLDDALNAATEAGSDSSKSFTMGPSTEEIFLQTARFRAGNARS